MQKQKFCVMAHQSKKLRNELETHRKMNTNLFVLFKTKKASVEIGLFKISNFYLRSKGKKQKAHQTKFNLSEFENENHKLFDQDYVTREQNLKKQSALDKKTFQNQHLNKSKIDKSLQKTRMNMVFL